MCVSKVMSPVVLISLAISKISEHPQRYNQVSLKLLLRSSIDPSFFILMSRTTVLIALGIVIPRLGGSIGYGKIKCSVSIRMCLKMEISICECNYEDYEAVDWLD